MILPSCWNRSQSVHEHIGTKWYRFLYQKPSNYIASRVIYCLYHIVFIILNISDISNSVLRWGTFIRFNWKLTSHSQSFKRFHCQKHSSCQWCLSTHSTPQNILLMVCYKFKLTRLYLRFFYFSLGTLLLHLSYVKNNTWKTVTSNVACEWYIILRK